MGSVLQSPPASFMALSCSLKQLKEFNFLCACMRFGTCIRTVGKDLQLEVELQGG